jgi:hypothetical protein
MQEVLDAIREVVDAIRRGVGDERAPLLGTISCEHGPSITLRACSS